MPGEADHPDEDRDLKRIRRDETQTDVTVDQGIFRIISALVEQLIQGSFQLWILIDPSDVLSVDRGVVLREKFRLLEMRDREVTRCNDQGDEGQIGDDVGLQFQIRLMALGGGKRMICDGRASSLIVPKSRSSTWERDSRPRRGTADKRRRPCRRARAWSDEHF